MYDFKIKKVKSRHQSGKREACMNQVQVAINKEALEKN